MVQVVKILPAEEKDLCILHNQAIAENLFKIAQKKLWREYVQTCLYIQQCNCHYNVNAMPGPRLAPYMYEYQLVKNYQLISKGKNGHKIAYNKLLSAIP